MNTGIPMADASSSIYVTTEDHSVSVSRTKNRLEVVGFGHLSLGGICSSWHFPSFSRRVEKPTKLV